MTQEKQHASAESNPELRTTTIPFTNQYALDHHRLRRGQSNSGDELDHVPDQPNIALDVVSVDHFLQQELSTLVLEQMYPYLWLFVTMDSSNIDALHGQIVKGREIIITEDPSLHLIWYRHRIFIKPIPPALLNHDFWECYLSLSSSLRKTALGFLRSYAFLVKHRSDLRIAIDTGLLPGDITWNSWQRFIHGFASLPDTAISPRFHFGQLRLNRLNIATQILGPKRKNVGKGINRYYHVVHRYTVSNLREFAAPLLFTFASVSSILSAMQVVLSLPPDSKPYTWVVKGTQPAVTFWVFCIIVLVGLAICWVLLLGYPLVHVLLQPVFGWQMRRRFLRRMNELQNERC